MYLLVPAHPGCPGQSPESCRMVVHACVRACMHVCVRACKEIVSPCLQLTVVCSPVRADIINARLLTVAALNPTITSTACHSRLQQLTSLAIIVFKMHSWARMGQSWPPAGPDCNMARNMQAGLGQKFLALCTSLLEKSAYLPYQTSNVNWLSCQTQAFHGCRRFGIVVASFIVSTKLPYVEPG